MCWIEYVFVEKQPRRQPRRFFNKIVLYQAQSTQNLLRVSKLNLIQIKGVKLNGFHTKLRYPLVLFSNFVQTSSYRGIVSYYRVCLYCQTSYYLKSDWINFIKSGSFFVYLCQQSLYFIQDMIYTDIQHRNALPCELLFSIVHLVV